MEVLVVDAPPPSSHTVYFDKPLVAPHFVTLISCSIFNSWHNLENPGRISFKKDDKLQDGADLEPGHHTPKSLSRALEETFDFQNRLTAHNYSPSGGLSIEKSENTNSVRIGRGLAASLGAKDTKITKLSVPRLLLHSTYYVYCDILTPSNGKPSLLLVQIDKRGRPYESVTYSQGEGLAAVLRACKSAQYIHALTLTVKDANGDLFEFNGLPLSFHLEIEF